MKWIHWLLLMVFTQVRSVVGILFTIPFTALWSVIVACIGIMGFSELATAMMRTWGRTLLFVFGIRLKIIGEELLPSKGGGIVVFNHQSLFDIPILMASTCKPIRFGAKIELFRIPLFSAAMRGVGTLPIVRTNHNEVLRVYKEAQKRFAMNTLFVLAPEGTRQSKAEIGRFKNGPFYFAVNAGVPIIPAVIKGAFPVLPKQSLNINIGRWSRTIHLQYLAMIVTKGVPPEEKLSAINESVRTRMVDCYANLPGDE